MYLKWTTDNFPPQAFASGAETTGLFTAFLGTNSLFDQLVCNRDAEAKRKVGSLAAAKAVFFKTFIYFFLFI